MAQQERGQLRFTPCPRCVKRTSRLPLSVNDKGVSNEENIGNILNHDFFIVSCCISIRQIISGCQLHNHRKIEYGKY
jgi:hypothetical protein